MNAKGKGNILKKLVIPRKASIPKRYITWQLNRVVEKLEHNSVLKCNHSVIKKKINDEFTVCNNSSSAVFYYGRVRMVQVYARWSDQMKIGMGTYHRRGTRERKWATLLAACFRVHRRYRLRWNFMSGTYFIYSGAVFQNCNRVRSWSFHLSRLDRSPIRVISTRWRQSPWVS